MLAPALDAISGDLHIGPDEANMAVSVFVLAFAFGLMALAPMTELSGRWNVWILPSMWYVVWNTACGFAHGKGLMLVGGVLAGLGASTEVACRSPIPSAGIAGAQNEATPSPSQQRPHRLRFLLFQRNIRAAPASRESGASRKTIRYPTIHNGIWLVSISAGRSYRVLSRYTVTCPTSAVRKCWSSHRQHSCCPFFCSRSLRRFSRSRRLPSKLLPGTDGFLETPPFYNWGMRSRKERGIYPDTMMLFLSASDTIARIAVVARDHLPSSSFSPRILSLSGDGPDNNDQSASPIITESDSTASESRDSLRGCGR